MTALSEAEVVVVGTAAGGSTIAGEAARAGRSVLVIEAGPAGDGRPGYHLRNEAPDEDRLGDFAERMRAELVHQSGVETGIEAIPGALTAHSVGGRLAVWFNNCPTPDGPERNSAVPEDDWPQLLDRARRLLHVNQQTGARSLREQRLLERLGERFPDLPPDRGVQPMPLAAEAMDDGSVRFAGADDLLLGAAERLPRNLTLMTETVARRVLHSGGRVTGIEVYPVGGGDRVVVSGETYVVAAGVLGTPQLLAASALDCGPSLGRYVMDHPVIGSRVPIDPVLLEGIADDDPGYSVWIPHSESRPWHTQISRTPWLDDVLDYAPRNTGDLFSFAGTEPRPENRFIYAEELDGFGLPAIQAEFSLSEADRHLVGRVVEDHWQVASSFGEYRRGWRPELFAASASMHLLGGCRMGAADDGSSVVNASSKAWRYDNLYLAGNAVFSDVSTCNPTLQTVALALRAADAILGR